MRGARTEDNPAPHLLAALDQIRGVVVGVFNGLCKP